MTMTLADAISRVRNYLDDLDSGTSGQRWSQSEIETSLAIGLEIVVEEMIANGVHQQIRLTTTGSLANGLITVPAHKKIISVFATQGNNKTIILPGAPRNRNYIYAGTSDIEIDYVAANVFPTGEDVFTYGSVEIENPILDAYLCCLAAEDLNVKEGEPKAVLAGRTAKYRTALLGAPTTGQVTVISAGDLSRQNNIYQLYYYKKSNSSLEVYV